MSKRRPKIWNSCHFFVTFLCLIGASLASAASIAGTYTGTYSGSDSGTVTITIDTFGNVFCSLTDKAGNTGAWANGAAISYVSGTENGTPDTQSNIACATALYFCPAGSVCSEPIQPEFNLGLTGGFQTGSNGSTTTIEGSWFTSIHDNSGSGGSGTFTATYSSAATAVSAVNSVSLSGLWYDPKYSGSGFNIAGSTAGLLIAYYGWDKSGNRLWLTSAIGPTQVTMGQDITLDLLQTSTGTFVAPAPPTSNAKWGTLTLNFSNCSTATAKLSGADGDLTESLSLLAGLNSLGCQ